MELKPGYKQTEVGVIPEDWVVKPLSKLPCEAIDCHHSTPIWKESGEIVIRNQNIRDGRLNLTVASYTDEKAYQERIRRAVPSHPDLVITREAPMGEVCMIPAGLKCCLGQRMVLLRIQSDTVDASYVLHALQAQSSRRFIGAVGGTGSTVSNIRIPILKSLPVAVPAHSEQRKISAALGDINELIIHLEKLILKKHNTKQAAMQELLTGKRRLPGFEGEWEVRRLGDVLSICHGKNQRDVEIPDGPYPILATGGQIGTADRPLHSKPYVLIGRKGTINKPQYMDSPFWTVDTLFFSAMKEGNSARFFYYLFCTIDWMQFNEASGVPSLNAKTIESIEVGCPATQEQDAVASVLSELDAELAALQVRKDKAQQLKQGMMQQLLTGKVRLT
jgi:type I restriction enzyme S subunit